MESLQRSRCAYLGQWPGFTALSSQAPTLLAAQQRVDSSLAGLQLLPAPAVVVGRLRDVSLGASRRLDTRRRCWRRSSSCFPGRCSCSFTMSLPPLARSSRSSSGFVNASSASALGTRRQRSDWHSPYSRSPAISCRWPMSAVAALVYTALRARQQARIRGRQVWTGLGRGAVIIALVALGPALLTVLPFWELSQQGPAKSL